MPPKSSPVPQRRMGMRGSTFSANFSLPMALAVMSVSIQPGRMALARTPWRANSTASARIIEIMPPLVAA